MRGPYTFGPIVAALALMGAAGQGADRVSGQPAPDTEVIGRHLRVRVDRDARPAAPGSTVSLYADVTPGPKIHIYAPGQDGYIPVDLALTAASAFKAIDAKYPPAVDFYFEPLRETVKVFNKPFRITQEIALAATPDLQRRAAARETLTIAGTLEYQACDDAVCYRPESLALTWKVPLQPARSH